MEATDKGGQGTQCAGRCMYVSEVTIFFLSTSKDFVIPFCKNQPSYVFLRDYLCNVQIIYTFPLNRFSELLSIMEIKFEFGYCVNSLVNILIFILGTR